MTPIARLRRRRIGWLLTWVMAAITVSGCHTPNDFILNDAKAAEFLDFQLSADRMAADGVSRVTVFVRLAENTDLDKRVVTFTTTLGKFVVDGKKDAKAVLPADSTGKVLVQLESETQAGTATVQATAGAITRTMSLELFALRPDEAFTVTVQTLVLPADGLSRSRVEVRLSRVGAADQRRVRFETTSGTLLAAGLPAQTSQEVTADSSGLAVVDQVAARSPGGAQLTIKTLGVEQRLQFRFDAAAPGHVISLRAQPTSAPADGATPITLIARINPNIDPANRTVGFTVSSADVMLAQTSSAPNANFEASSFARSSKPGSYTASATVDGSRVDEPIVFHPALAERVHVTTTDAELSSGGSTDVTVTLLRDVGTPSADQIIRYSARTQTGQSIGTFSAVALSTGRSATARFNLGTTSFVGTVTITAVAPGGVSGSTIVRVN